LITQYYTDYEYSVPVEKIGTQRKAFKKTSVSLQNTQNSNPKI
jgi:hypothetical protein